MDQRITANFEQVCKDIKDKKPIDYVGAYELLQHDKLKKEIFNSHTKQGAPDKGGRSRANSSSSIVSQLPASVAYSGQQFYSVEKAESRISPTQLTTKLVANYHSSHRKSLEGTLNQSMTSLQHQDSGGKKYISDLHLNKLKELQKKF